MGRDLLAYELGKALVSKPVPETVAYMKKQMRLDREVFQGPDRSVQISESVFL